MNPPGAPWLRKDETAKLDTVGNRWPEEVTYLKGRMKNKIKVQPPRLLITETHKSPIILCMKE